MSDFEIEGDSDSDFNFLDTSYDAKGPSKPQKAIASKPSAAGKLGATLFGGGASAASQESFLARPELAQAQYLKEVVMSTITMFELHRKAQRRSKVRRTPSKKEKDYNSTKASSANIEKMSTLTLRL